MHLRIIEAVFKRDPDLGVGMEMFQRPFQDVLDSFIAAVQKRMGIESA